MATVNEMPARQAAGEETPPDNFDRNGANDKPGHSTRYWVMFGLLVIVAAAAVIFFAWLPRQKRSQAINQEAKERVEELPRVPVQRVRRAPRVSELSIPGTTLAYTEAHIY